MIRALREIGRRGLFCAFVQRSRQPSLVDSEGRGKVDYGRLTEVGRAMRELGIHSFPARRSPADARSATLTPGRGGCHRLSAAPHQHPGRVQSVFCASTILPGQRTLNLIFSLHYERTVNGDNTLSFQNLILQIEQVAWRAAP